MSGFDDEWSRKDAEQRIAILLNSAKSGHPQKIVDFDGSFEVTFTPAKTGESLSSLLAKGNPFEDENG